MKIQTHLYIRWTFIEAERTGRFQIENGRIITVAACNDRVEALADGVKILDGDAMVEILLECEDVAYGKKATILRWECSIEGFSLLPATVPRKGILDIAGLEVRVSRWTISQFTSHIEDLGSEESHLSNDPRGRDITWEAWAKKNIHSSVPTVLGVARDHRLFVFDQESFIIKSMLDLFTGLIEYDLHRPSTANPNISRWLEDGSLPILHVQSIVGDLLIEDTLFATDVLNPLEEEYWPGTPIRVAHYYSALATFPPGEEEKAKSESEEFAAPGDMAIFLRTKVTNLGNTSVLAPMRLPRVSTINKKKDRSTMPERIDDRDLRLDQRGTIWIEERPFSRHLVNSKVPEALAPCHLLDPGETLIFDSVLAHDLKGLSEAALRSPITWEAKYEEAKKYWTSRLKAAARISVPEKHLENFWKAGLLQLDLLTLGERSGSLTAKVGLYACIGSESLPIVEFYDSLGWHDTARRCIDVFFEFQHPNGRINTYQYYDIETGAVLYMAGRHFAYTRDVDWLRKQRAGILAAVEYLISLRSLDKSLPGYGLIAGTCADPKEQTTSLMLNSYNAAGLREAAYLLAVIDDPKASEYRAVAEDYGNCLRSAIGRSFSLGPVLPARDGRWVPSCAPSAEGTGPQAMGLNGEDSFTHRSYFAFDSMLGPLYAPFLGIIPAQSRETDWLLDIAETHYHRGTIGESQPYYSRHPELHLLRGERESFLNAFYSGLTALSDRETYSFWEHLHKVSYHKTHEEAWALMQMRRMLWLESDENLNLLSGIPEWWLDEGKTISIENGVSYFGRFTLNVRRNGDRLQIRWESDFHTQPSSVFLHLPGIHWDEMPEIEGAVLNGHLIKLRNPQLKLFSEITLTSKDVDSALTPSLEILRG